jgi:hypothetical protein
MYVPIIGGSHRKRGISPREHYADFEIQSYRSKLDVCDDRSKESAAMLEPDDPNLNPDAVVTKLMRDRSESPPGVIMLHGYVGESPTQDKILLYLTSSLHSYVAIPKTEILHSHKLADEQGTLVWVSSRLALEHTQIASSEEVQARFLAGPILGTNIGFGLAALLDMMGTLRITFASVCLTGPPSIS